MCFTESVAAGRAFARHDDPRPAPNRELIALGAANLAGSFFQTFPAGGGTSQTAVNSKAGARTQVSALFTVAMVAATLLFSRPSSAWYRRPRWQRSWSLPRHRCSARLIFDPFYG
jgi:sulfate permease, SulP family